jgi:hypothetical protein
VYADRVPPLDEVAEAYGDAETARKMGIAVIDAAPVRA